MLEQKVSAELEGLLNQYDKSRSHESKTEQSCMVDHEDEDATMVPCTAPDWDPHSEGTRSLSVYFLSPVFLSPFLTTITLSSAGNDISIADYSNIIFPSAD